MKLTINDIYNLEEGLAVLSEKDLAISTALKIQQNHKKVMEEFTAAEHVRVRIVTKYKDKDLENGQVLIKKDKTDVYRQELSELMDQKVDIKLKKINTSNLKTITIKPKYLALLDKLLIVKEDEGN